MRWKAGTFEKIETNDSSIEQLINTFKTKLKWWSSNKLF